MTEDTHVSVGDAMTDSVRMIPALATVKDAIEAMRNAGVSSLVVERRDATDEFGLLVVTDIACEVIAKGRSVERVNVYEVMSKPVVALAPEMRIEYAVRLLVRFGLSRALVVDRERQPVGMVTLRDLVLRYGAPLDRGGC